MEGRKEGGIDGCERKGRRKGRGRKEGRKEERGRKKGMVEREKDGQSEAGNREEIFIDKETLRRKTT